MDLWIATTSKGKLAEFKRMLPATLNIRTLAEIKNYSPPEETGATFFENAILKARALHRLYPNSWVIAEDSGLCVDALNGAPGIYSARFASETASDAENIEHLLRELKDVPAKNRTAYFYCSMVLMAPKEHQIKSPLEFTGKASGHIALSPMGNAGFGYDPCFIPEGQTQSFAELGADFKDKVSHRKQALSRLVQNVFFNY